MGWGYAVESSGREIGYSVDTMCEHVGCHAQINRGLYYACGDYPDGGEHGCGHYFCSDHLYYVEGCGEQVCDACSVTFDEEHPR